MATLFNRSERGRPVRMLQVLVPGMGRKTLRLDRLPQRAAERFREKVEGLVACRRLNLPPDAEAVAWLRGLADDAYAALADAGLAEPRESVGSTPTVGAFLDKYIASRVGEISARSIQLLEQTQARLVAHFGSAARLDRVTPDGALDWRAALIGSGLSEATARLHTRNAKSVFNAAVDRELIARNPFRKLPSSAVAANRDHYVSADDAEKVIAALPDHEWRLLFGLARYAGLRIASESHILTWDRVDLDGRRLSVYAPKTGRTRTVPVVPRLAELLADAHARREPGYEDMFTITTNNLHRTVLEAIERAGLQRWPDLFQTLRRSCETDFASRFPVHVAAGWLGHSPAVSARHYLQIPDAMLDAAAEIPPSSALHQALQHRTAPRRTEPQSNGRAKTPRLAHVA